MVENPLSFTFVSSIAQVNEQAWQAIANPHGPLLSYSFLHALEQTRCVGDATGWQPHHLLIYQNSDLIGMLPLYIKTHSYGEYVFDFAWANSYHHHGREYYPKLVSAVPFTPVTGTRLMLTDGYEQAQVLPDLEAFLRNACKEQNLSSMHWLFVQQQQSASLSQHNFLQRLSVQFIWFNRAYDSFDDFLSRFHARRRKSVKKERQKITQQGIEVTRLSGTTIEPHHVDIFYQCYKATYLKRSGHEGYLTRAFFHQLLQRMPNNLLLVVATQNTTPIAAAFYLFDDKQLCGRYWGAIEAADGLHFECCYYQGIEFCIERNIPSFNPGTQGEHKILRGFEPQFCYSNHWLAAEEFHHAVGEFIRLERCQLEDYRRRATSLLPFKQST